MHFYEALTGSGSHFDVGVKINKINQINLGNMSVVNAEFIVSEDVAFFVHYPVVKDI